MDVGLHFSNYYTCITPFSVESNIPYERKIMDFKWQ